MPTPWLSILIPVYKVERWLTECVDSVSAQADSGVEILLLDDASPDRSGELANQLAATQPNIQVLRHPHNRGLSAARNSLLAAARGDYVWFLDSDDLLLPGAIDALRAAVADGGPDLVLCDFRVIRERFKLMHRLRGELHRRTFAGPSGRTRTAGAELLMGLLEPGQLHSWSKIGKRELWQQAPFPEGRYFEDIAVIPGLVAHARSYHYVAQPWVGYRQREDSILAQQSAEKIRHQLHNTLDLQRGLSALPCASDPQAGFALEHFCLRTLVSMSRRARSLRPESSELADEIRAAMRTLLPRGLDAVLSAYLRRGWWIRRLRARRGLAWTQAEASHPAAGKS